MLCYVCKKKPTKALRREARPYFCSRACAVIYAIRGIEDVAKHAGCPQCKSLFTHKTREEYGWGGDYVCGECNHRWNK